MMIDDDVDSVVYDTVTMLVLLQTAQYGTLTVPAPTRQRVPTLTCTCTQWPSSKTRFVVARTNWFCVRSTSTTKSLQVRNGNATAILKREDIAWLKVNPGRVQSFFFFFHIASLTLSAEIACWWSAALMFKRV